MDRWEKKKNWITRIWNWVSIEKKEIHDLSSEVCKTWIFVWKWGGFQYIPSDGSVVALVVVWACDLPSKSKRWQMHQEQTRSSKGVGDLDMNPFMVLLRKAPTQGPDISEAEN